MDTAIPVAGGRDRGYSIGGDDYSDLILEVTAESHEQEIVIQNASEWTSKAISNVSGSSSAAFADTVNTWSEQDIKEKEYSQKIEIREKKVFEVRTIYYSFILFVLFIYFNSVCRSTG